MRRHLTNITSGITSCILFFLLIDISKFIEEIRHSSTGYLIIIIFNRGRSIQLDQRQSQILRTISLIGHVELISVLVTELNDAQN